MADVAETKETTPVVEKEVAAEKEVEDVEAPKVAEVEEKADENGKSEEPAAAAATTENGTSDKEEDSKDGEEETPEKENNGESTDAPAEAVKRKVTADDPVEGTPEKKSKLAESEVETNGTTETEAAA